MSCYIYEGEIYCSGCACEGDTYCYDMGEADYPVHCADCGDFMENSLTRDGEDYVKEAVANGDEDSIACRVWRTYYDYLEY